MTLASPQFNPNPGPIIGAGTRGTIYDVGNQPQVGAALNGWFMPMVIEIITRTIGDKGRSVQRVAQVSTAGVMQPGDPEKLKMLAEGNRSWKNWTLHADPGLKLANNQKIRIKDIQYTVMESLDYDANGYAQFELVEGYHDIGR